MARHLTQGLVRFHEQLRTCHETAVRGVLQRGECPNRELKWCSRIMVSMARHWFSVSTAPTMAEEILRLKTASILASASCRQRPVEILRIRPGSMDRYVERKLMAGAESSNSSASACSVHDSRTESVGVRCGSA